ncbi:protein zer-1-like protein [Leptotrombidium deliense]|uniref:Protein zer-1 homolog n=1 Tax=Leptotrombidium deliense TaxID=299467 RepID=A0A443SKW4_9ACAR|nr:protein zer-1-like protein [Leptotrombidium deliense]
MAVKRQSQFISNDNSPESLLLLCVRFVVKNEVKFGDLCLPQEICNVILEIYGETNCYDLNEKKLHKFLSQFKKSSSRITVGLLSDLPVTDYLLEMFLKQQAKNLQVLEIDDCTNLTPNTLTAINTIFTEINDIRKMTRIVKITERDNDKCEAKVMTKCYENGVITTSICDTHSEQNVGILENDHAIYEAMGLFDDIYIKKSVMRRRLDENFKPISTFSEPIKPNQQFRLIVCGEGGKKTEKITEIYSFQKCPLQSLIIGRSTQILPDNITKDDDDFYLFNPHLALKKLVIHGWTSMENPAYIDAIITPQLYTSLQYLDLSNCPPFGEGKALLNLEVLTTLILYNCPRINLSTIAKIKTLRHLDISSSNDRYGHGYKNPDAQLAELVNSLSHLTHLDISGTNLAGPRCERIKGLSSRYNNHFEFLGLYNTVHEAAYRHPLPSLRVAGDATEPQILTACEAYIERVELLRHTLNDLFHCFRFEVFFCSDHQIVIDLSFQTDFHDVNRALDVVLLSMGRHLHEKQIQIAASASLFYIVKSDEAKHNFNIKIKRQIIVRLLDAMQTHKYDSMMLRNGSLTLIHFKIPQDVIFEYKRLVAMLLHIVTNDNDDFIQRLGIYLLNSLACQVDGEQKTLVGDLGAIKVMLSLISNRIDRKVCDEVMETAWSTMWNVTDETPVNCERFLNYHGMEYFLKCMEIFPNQAELLRNMMGLLGNVAECKHLRYKLMKPEYIDKCSALLWSESDGIEVSYNAAGILSHIISDGAEFWQNYLPQIDRNTILNRMREAISKWKINSKRTINYRSFEPILRLLKPNIETSEAQYWAIWALANLTRVSSQKYCPLLLEESGIKILKDLIARETLSAHIKDLCLVTIFQVER